MIQVECPINWLIENIIKIVNEIKWIELYNAEKIRKSEVTKSKFNFVQTTISI
jgi:hypothetical protein